jgi:hypothetical protein
VETPRGGGWHPQLIKRIVEPGLRSVDGNLGGLEEMAQLFGALVGTYLISRLFWIVAKAWPDSINKAVSLNVVCAAIIIPIDSLLREDVSFTQELALYGGCQMLVLMFDLWRLKRGFGIAGAPPASNT